MQNIGPIIIFNFNRKVPEFTFLSKSLFTWTALTPTPSGRVRCWSAAACSVFSNPGRLSRSPPPPSLPRFGRAVHGAGKWHMPLLVSETMTWNRALVHQKQRMLAYSPEKRGRSGFQGSALIQLGYVGKTSWRIMTNPNSLCSQVLKAKYFPDSNILNCTARLGISYTWRSILQGVQLLKGGVAWRVGNDTSLNIWSDPWGSLVGLLLQESILY